MASNSSASKSKIRRKMLLMGKQNAGKTSMRSIIFANFVARDTTRLDPTYDIENTNMKFLGNLALNLWDMGGQDYYMDSYMKSQKDQIFQQVEVLIYVIDVTSNDLGKDYKYYSQCLEALKTYSPDAKVFCLVHKMDLIIGDEEKERVFCEHQEDLRRLSDGKNISFCATSIWDETLYKAWSKIVYQLIPNVDVFESNLKNFADIIEADDVVLFERTTFLVIASYERVPHKDVNRYERLCNMMKHFKLSCLKIGTMFSSCVVRNEFFTTFIDSFTSNTFIMVIHSDLDTSPDLITLNIRSAAKTFQRIEDRNRNSERR